MDRKEFCQLLPLIRKESGIKMKEMCFVMNTMPTTIYRLEKGIGNFAINQMFSYFDALHKKIYLIKDAEYEIKNIEDFRGWLKNVRINRYSQRSLAMAVGCTHATIANIERGANIPTIDLFLKIVDALEYHIDIKPYPNNK